MANFVGFLAARQAKAPWDVRVDGAAPARESRAARLHLCARRTPGSTRPPTSSASAPARSAGSRPTTRSGWTWTRCAAQIARGPRRRAAAVPRRRHGRDRVSTGAVDPLAAHRRGLPRARGSGSTSTGRTAASRPACPARPEDLAGHRAGRLGRGRSAQVALRAARGRLRARARPRARCATPSSTSRPTTTSGTRATGDERHQLLRVRRRRTRAASGRSRSGWRLRMAGQQGYRRMIARRHGAGARALRGAERHPELEAFTRAGSRVTTFRYVPAELAAERRAGRGVPRPPEHRAPHAAPGGRRGVPLQRGRAGAVPAALLHRQLPDDGRATSPRSRRSWRGRAGQLTGT